MVFVVAHAKPAKFILALSTRHMHAALIFLNHALALGTRLGVEFDPNLGVFIRVAHPIQPLLKQLAFERLMRYFVALVTRHLIAF